MNRLTSVLTGAITTALSGAAVAAATVGQGVFDQGGPAPKPDATTAVSAWNSDSAAATAATQAPQVAQAPRIVYVDKDPVIITTGAPAGPMTNGAAQRAEPETPTVVPTVAPKPPASAVPGPASTVPVDRAMDSPKQGPAPAAASAPPVAPKAPETREPEHTATVLAPAPTQPAAVATARPTQPRTTTTPEPKEVEHDD